MIVRHSSSMSTIRAAAHVLGDSARDYDPLLRMVGDRSFVLLGEATHGTHEFYAMRAQVTQRLIAELGFDAVAVEGDWPDAPAQQAPMDRTPVGGQPYASRCHHLL